MTQERFMKLSDKMVEEIKNCIGEPAYSAFLCERHWYGNTTININDVNGSNHPDYVNKTWNYVLENAPRIDKNLERLEQKPDYYLSKDKKQPNLDFKAIFWKGDDKAKFMFPYHNGNHRTAIAKAFLHCKGVSELHGVTLYKDVYDYELYQAYDFFNYIPSLERYIRVYVIHEDSAFIDESDYSVLHQKVMLKVTNHRSNVDLLLNAQETYELIEESRINPLRRLFRKNRYAKFLRGDREL